MKSALVFLACLFAFSVALPPVTIDGVIGYVRPACNSSGTYQRGLGDGLYFSLTLDGYNANTNDTTSVGAISVTMTGDRLPDFPAVLAPTGVPEVVRGRVGNAFRFTASISGGRIFKNWLRMAPNTAFNFGDTTSPGSAPDFTVAFWVHYNRFQMPILAVPPAPPATLLLYPDVFLFGTRFMNVDDAEGNRGRTATAPWWAISIGPNRASGTTVRATIATNSDTDVINDDFSSGNIAANTWTFVAMRVSKTMPLGISLNGAAYTNYTFGGACGALPAGSCTLDFPAFLKQMYLGTAQFNQDETWPLLGLGEPTYYQSTFNYNFTIDEFTIWTRPLSDAELGEAYQRGLAGLPLSTAPKGNCSCNPGFFQEGKTNCVPCASQCGSCLGTASYCLTCASSGVVPVCTAPPPPPSATTAGSATAGSTTAGSTTAGSTTAGSTTAGSTTAGGPSPPPGPAAGLQSPKSSSGPSMVIIGAAAGGAFVVIVVVTVSVLLCRKKKFGSRDDAYNEKADLALDDAPPK